MPEGCVVIVGASGGVGSELSRRLADRGVKLMLAGRGEEKLSRLGEELGVSWRVTEASDFDDVERLFSEAADEHGGVWGAVNLAGSIILKPSHATSKSDLEDALAQNVTTAFAVTRSASKVMRRGEGGSIVLVSSCAATVGLSNHEAISAAKAGVEGLTRAAAATYAEAGIRVNAVAPGLVDTPMASSIIANDAARKYSEAMHPLGRLGKPEDVASAINWLLDLENSWVTGQVLGVDGGLACVRGKAKG